MGLNAITGIEDAFTPLGTFVAADAAEVSLSRQAAECAIAARIRHRDGAFRAAEAGRPVATCRGVDTAFRVAWDGVPLLEFVNQ